MKKNKIKKKNEPDINYDYIYIIIILVITFFSFYPSLTNGFTNWDDDWYLINNNMIKSLSFHNIKQIFITPCMGMYHPLTMLSYSLDYHFFKLNPFYYHFSNLIFHLLNCLLLYKILLLLRVNSFLSFLTVLFWAVHPLRVESVAWISERKDVLCAFFLFLSLINYLYYIKENNNKFYYLSLFLFICSLLSKPMAVTLPFILILVDYILQKPFDKKRIVNKIPYFVISLIFGIIAIITQKQVNTITSPPLYGTFDNFIMAGYGILFYLYKFFCPLNLSNIYPYPVKTSNFLPLHILLSPLFIILISVIVYYSKKYTNKIRIALLFFIITLLPVLKIVPIGNQMAADRYTYIPSIALSYLMGELFFCLFNKYLSSSKDRKILFYSIVTILIITLSFTTWNRCCIWKDSLTLWNDCLSKCQWNVAYSNLGNAYLEKGDEVKAIDCFTKGLTLQPDMDAYTHRGQLYSKKGEFEKALDDFNKSLNISKVNPRAYLGRGIVYAQKGDYDKAIEDLTKAIELKPDYLEAYNNRGNVYKSKGELEKALNDYDKGLEINNSYTKLYYNRGLIYEITGDYNLAINDYNQALAIDPQYFAVYHRRAYVYFLIKDYDKAWQDVYTLQSSGQQVAPELIEELNKVSR